MAGIRVRSLTLRYPPGGGLNRVDLDVTSGQRLAVIGPSGSGKTTLLRLIAGLETPDDGTVAIDDRDVTSLPAHDRGVGFVSQSPALYPHLDVLRNLTIGVELRRGLRRPDGPLRARAEEVAGWLGLTARLARSVESLSGGERQRVALGRVVVSSHRVWLLDEPMAHLDPATAMELRDQLALLHARLSPTIIEVTHDPGDALASDRVCVLLDGRVAQVGPPAEVSARPNSRGVATSLGWPPMNFIDGPAAPAAGASESVCAWGVHPRDIGLGPAPAGAVDLGDWDLLRVEPTAPRPTWVLTLGGQRLRRWADDGDRPDPRVRLHARHWSRFDRLTGSRLDDALEG